MTLRTCEQIRAEIARWRAVAATRRPKGELESLAAILIVQALTWTLGEAESVTTRQRI